MDRTVDLVVSFVIALVGSVFVLLGVWICALVASHVSAVYLDGTPLAGLALWVAIIATVVVPVWLWARLYRWRHAKRPNAPARTRDQPSWWC